MLIQLGNKRFEGFFAPSSWSYSGNEANLAEYELINTKPRIQHTGETLEELTFNFNLRAEFCNPAQEIKDLEQWKREGAVLPLLLGTGEFLNNYVIRSVEKDVLNTAPDGTVIDARITLNLLEYVPDNEDAAEASESRRNAAAVGDKRQINRRPDQPLSSEAEAHKSLLEAQNKAWEAAEEAEKLNAASQPGQHISKVKKAIKRAQDGMDDARSQVSEVQENINGATGILEQIQNSKNKMEEMDELLSPPLSTQAIGGSILNVQTSIRGINGASTLFSEQVILRQI